jgi:hypothetical protein
MKKTALSLLVAAAAVLVFACNGPHKYVGSCDMREGSSGGDSKICIDVYTTRNLDAVKAICAGDPGYKWLATPCDRKEVVGGCRDDKTIMWHYKSGEVTTSADVTKECLSDQKLVPADWKEQEKP